MSAVYEQLNEEKVRWISCLCLALSCLAIFVSCLVLSCLCPVVPCVLCCLALCCVEVLCFVVPSCVILVVFCCIVLCCVALSFVVWTFNCLVSLFLVFVLLWSCRAIFLRCLAIVLWLSSDCLVLQVKAYVLCHPELCAILVGGDETITCADLIVTEIGDGNLNFVYLVKTKLDHSSNGKTRAERIRQYKEKDTDTETNTSTKTTTKPRRDLTIPPQRKAITRKAITRQYNASFLKNPKLSPLHMIFFSSFVLCCLMTFLWFSCDYSCLVMVLSLWLSCRVFALRSLPCLGWSYLLSQAESLS